MAQRVSIVGKEPLLAARRQHSRKLDRFHFLEASVMVKDVSDAVFGLLGFGHPAPVENMGPLLENDSRCLASGCRAGPEQDGSLYFTVWQLSILTVTQRRPVIFAGHRSRRSLNGS